MFDPANNVGIPPGTSAEPTPGGRLDELIPGSPQGQDPGEYDPGVQYPEHLVERPQEFRLVIPDPLPVVPGRTTVINSGTLELDASYVNRPAMLGAQLDPGQASARLTIWVRGAAGVYFADEQSALPGQRFAYHAATAAVPGSTVPLVLDGLDRLYVWTRDIGAGTGVEVSWLLTVRK